MCLELFTVKKNNKFSSFLTKLKKKTLKEIESINVMKKLNKKNMLNYY